MSGSDRVHCKVAVTGRGIVTALGAGLQTNWRKLVAGESGVSDLRRFDASGLKTRIAATVDLFPQSATVSNAEITYGCAQEALQQALDEALLPPSLRTGLPLFYATSAPSADWRQRLVLHQDCARKDRSLSLAALRHGNCRLVNSIESANDCAYNGARLADEFGFHGPVVSVTTACASGASAIQLAVECIRRGEYSRALVVAADAAVSHENLARFSLLSALSVANADPAGASRPFDLARDGFVMGEGGAALVLESEQSVAERGAEAIGYILGCGNATDNFHKTRSNPSGEHIVRSMQSALTDAGLSPHEIDSINAHGTSTQENDKMESLGINLLFGDHARNIHVTSNKSMIGHTLCAAGAIEALFSLESILSQVVPPTINLQQLDPAVHLNVVAGTRREARIRTVLSNSFGFGGQNVSLVVAAVS